MLEVFTKLRVLSHYIDSGARGRSWDQASQMLSEGDAAMQIMGDWVAGYLTKDQQTLSDNIICSAFPGSQNSFIYNVDSFAFFKLKQVSAATKQAQVALASTILQPQLQVAFNRQKGSLPVVNDIDTSQFNRCTQQSALAYQMALKQNTLVPTFAQAMATTSYAQAAITRVVNNFIYDKNMSAQQAVIQLVNAVAAAQ
jgi:glucose/mannose transport system substrate-binding protein